jgi:hypothetical protein
MTLPDFLVIGAMRAGTTALYRFLMQHPQIYLSPIKEPKFFALENHPLDFRGPGDRVRMRRDARVSRDSYAALFRDAPAASAVGEASTLYLYSDTAPLAIRRLRPDVRLIAVLRHPVDRAYSAYLHMVKKGWEPLRDFRAALLAEDERLREHWAPDTWPYRHMGFYAAQLARYVSLFDREQVRVYLYEDLCARPVPVLQDMFRFLGVDAGFVPDVSLRYNVSGIPRSARLQALINRPPRLKTAVETVLPERWRVRLGLAVHRWNLTRPALDEETRRDLLDGYREDVLRLEDLIRRDLSGWLAERSVALPR